MAERSQQRADLELLRETLLAALADAPAAVKAQVAGQLRAVIKDLAAIGSEAEGSKADELAARRAARRSAPADSAGTARRGQPRRSGGGNRTS